VPRRSHLGPRRAARPGPRARRGAGAAPALARAIGVAGVPGHPPPSRGAHPAAGRRRRPIAADPTDPGRRRRGIGRPTMSNQTVIHEETLAGGLAWSRRLKPNQVLRLTDVTGRACVSALFYNARDPIERYNMPDTLKAQHTAFLTAGRVLYSDMGRILVSVV